MGANIVVLGYNNLKETQIVAKNVVDQKPMEGLKLRKLKAKGAALCFSPWAPPCVGTPMSVALVCWVTLEARASIFPPPPQR